MNKETMRIGEIGNYYGGLHVKKEEDKYYWGIEDWDGTHWKEITKKLYDSLVKFNKREVTNNET